MPPQQKPGKSEQSVQTPEDFLEAVYKLLNYNGFYWDLAAEEHNKVGLKYFDKETDSLSEVWHILGGWLWLNPPYAKLGPWMEKCFIESRLGAKIAVLVPASVGSNWWANYVDGKAQVYFLRDRITFVGHTAPYPKDLALLLYRNDVTGGYSSWDWKASLK